MEQTEAFLQDLRALAPAMDYASLEQVFELVPICRDHRLTPYDALYIELASRMQCSLATQDETQQAAAKAVLVECL